MVVHKFPPALDDKHKALAARTPRDELGFLVQTLRRTLSMEREEHNQVRLAFAHFKKVFRENYLQVFLVVEDKIMETSNANLEVYLDEVEGKDTDVMHVKPEGRGVVYMNRSEIPWDKGDDFDSALSPGAKTHNPKKYTKEESDAAWSSLGRKFGGERLHDGVRRLEEDKKGAVLVRSAKQIAEHSDKIIQAWKDSYKERRDDDLPDSHPDAKDLGCGYRGDDE